MHLLSYEIKFPHPSESDENGLLAIGGDLSSERLKHAYNNGIFPWCNENEPLLWWSPNPRMVLFPRELRISKSMKVILKKEIFKITFNKAFHEVIRQCAKIKREDQEDTWITNDMINAYSELHKEGHAISVEVWKDEKLVGGLYGINLKDKKIFCGESMFSKVSNASKAAFITLVENLKIKEYKIIDCQMYTTHLESLGAREIDREDFLKMLS
ncbi:leucyl/phenylalanyl-tRNA--protein transferase [Flavobacteriaceae bacterium]|nr:leucyl/phenylalanyl-tRNA--protein transferase [Flavobacteriaceae bacterium]